MRIENDEGVVVDLPDSLAKLLVEHQEWHTTRRKVTEPPPLDFTAEDDRVVGRGEDEPALPMTHIPGVVPGISMNRLKKLVADGTVPHVLKNRTKLVKPSDVRAVLEQENTNG